MASAASGRVTGFLLRNALANAGGVIAFLPLLTLLLPIKIEAVAGDSRIGVLTAAVVVGAFAASGSNILFGWLSDLAIERGYGRRPSMIVGLALLALAYTGVALASTPATIVLAIGFFEFAVNALLAPMFALMADEIPDSHKRTAGGLLAAGHPLGAATSLALVTWPLHEGSQLAIIALLVTLCALPLLMTRARPAVAVEEPVPQQVLRRDLLIVWSARMLLQIAGAVLSRFLFYYFQSISPGMQSEAVASGLASLLLVCNLLPLPIAVIAGRWSDRAGRAKPFLVGSASVAALGLAGMAFAQDWNQGAIAFALYSAGWSSFLAVQAGFAMQLLPNPKRRGRDLGLMNLTNTLPGLLGPGMTWLLATPQDFGSALLTAAGLTLCGALLILAVRGRR